ncbi:MAG: HIT family protein [Deltaproteobacteria bacterium]|nr:HIT family protein [Deltaproteobacteria bacterium]MBW2071499.1 HIT family protein [Deltaproteobacteria bacterium]
MPDCIFCQIVDGKIPSAKIKESDTVLAFLDINPVSKGHCLVIPKAHYATFADIPADVLTDMGKTLQQIGTAVEKVLGNEGYNVLLNNGRAAGQLIDHAHFHIVPRNTGDGVMEWPEVHPYSEGEMENIRQALAEAVS